MNREVRFVRPFNVPHQFDEALDGVRFRMGSNVCEPDSSVLVGADDEYLRALPEIVWADSDESLTSFVSALLRGASDARLNPRDLTLAVTAHTSYLKITSLLYQCTLDCLDVLEHRVSFDRPRPDALLASKSGAEISVCVLLTNELKPQGLRPWRKSTWLARKKFAIRTDDVRGWFRPIPLDSETRRQLGLPSTTVRYVNVEAPFEPVGSGNEPEFYVDADLLGQIDRSGGSAIGKAFQAQLACDFVSAVIMASNSSSEMLQDATWEDVQGSLVGKVVNLVLDAKMAPEEKFASLRSHLDNPTKFMALVEGALKLRPTMLKSFSEEQ